MNAIPMFTILYNIFFYAFIVLACAFLWFGVTSFDYILIGIGILFGMACLLMIFDNQ